MTVEARTTARSDGFTCIDFALGELLPLRAAGLLEPHEQAQVDAHCDACHACERDAEILRQVLRAADTLGAPEHGRAALATSSAARSADHRRVRLLALCGGIAATAALLALAVIASQQRATGHAVVAEVAALRSRIATLEQRDGQGPAALGAAVPADRPLLPFGVRLASPPSF